MNLCADRFDSKISCFLFEVDDVDVMILITCESILKTKTRLAKTVPDLKHRHARLYLLAREGVACGLERGLAALY